jgi:hypothetical protein
VCLSNLPFRTPGKTGIVIHILFKRKLRLRGVKDTTQDDSSLLSYPGFVALYHFTFSWWELSQVNCEKLPKWQEKNGEEDGFLSGLSGTLSKLSPPFIISSYFTTLQIVEN